MTMPAPLMAVRELPPSRSERSNHHAHTRNQKKGGQTEAALPAAQSSRATRARAASSWSLRTATCVCRATCPARLRCWRTRSARPGACHSPTAAQAAISPHSNSSCVLNALTAWPQCHRGQTMPSWADRLRLLSTPAPQQHPFLPQPIPVRHENDSTCVGIFGASGRRVSERLSNRGRQVLAERRPQRHVAPRQAACRAYRLRPALDGLRGRGLRRQVGGEPKPFRVSICAARTLNPAGQSRVTLSLRQEHLRAAYGPRQEERGPEIRPKRSSQVPSHPTTSFVTSIVPTKAPSVPLALGPRLRRTRQRLCSVRTLRWPGR